MHVHVPSALCPGEHPQLCECAIVCVAAHRGGHGQPPLPLSVLGLMLGHVPRRTLTRTLTLTLTPTRSQTPPARQRQP